MKEISPDKLIAHGRTADVYVWDDGHVLKLFKNWFDLENIEYELRIAPRSMTAACKLRLSSN